jgi:hypothetical protein
MDGLILGIDPGKFNSVCRSYDTTIKSGAFRQAKSTLADLGRPSTQLLAADVVTEAESPAGWMHDHCAELGVPCFRACA